jgi:hypothetical protein
MDTRVRFANTWARQRFLRHEQPIGHPLLEVLQHRRLVPWYRDRKRLACGRPKFDDVCAVSLRAKDMMFSCLAAFVTGIVIAVANMLS